MKICNKILQIGLLSAALGSLFGCSVAGRLQRQQATAGLAQLTRAERQERQQARPRRARWMNKRSPQHWA